MFGAPFGASTCLGKSFVDSLVVRPSFPPKGCSGLGKTSSAHIGNAMVAPSTSVKEANLVFVFMVVAFMAMWFRC
jgi:hypothetical protein